MPTKQTLKKYGMGQQDYLKLELMCDRTCPICCREFSEGKLVIDHEHVKGFKKMKDKDKRKYVRGLLCSYCNFRMIPKGMSAYKAYQIFRYLQKYLEQGGPL